MFGTKSRERGICNYPRLPASVSATALPTLNSWEINQEHRFLAAALSWGSGADTPDVIETKPRWEAAGIETSACPQGAMLSLHWSCDSEPHLYWASVLSFPASFQGMCWCPRSIHPSQKWQNRAVPTHPLGAPHHLEFTHSCSSFRMEEGNKEPCLTTFFNTYSFKQCFYEMQHFKIPSRTQIF